MGQLAYSLSPIAIPVRFCAAAARSSPGFQCSSPDGPAVASSGNPCPSASTLLGRSKIPAETETAQSPDDRGDNMDHPPNALMPKDAKSLPMFLSIQTIAVPRQPLRYLYIYTYIVLLPVPVDYRT